MNREEHLNWCKDRAMEYVERNDFTNAVASISSDLKKHPETADHPGIHLGMMLMMSGLLSSKTEAEKFIQGFN